MPVKMFKWYIASPVETEINISIPFTIVALSSESTSIAPVSFRMTTINATIPNMAMSTENYKVRIYTRRIKL